MNWQYYVPYVPCFYIKHVFFKRYIFDGQTQIYRMANIEFK